MQKEKAELMYILHTPPACRTHTPELLPQRLSSLVDNQNPSGVKNVRLRTRERRTGSSITAMDLAKPISYAQQQGLYFT